MSECYFHRVRFACKFCGVLGLVIGVNLSLKVSVRKLNLGNNQDRITRTGQASKS